MKKVLENYGGYVLFYAVIIIGTLILCSINSYNHLTSTMPDESFLHSLSAK